MALLVISIALFALSRVDTVVGCLSSTIATFGGLHSTSGGFAGDGGDATDASLSYPNDVWTDTSGVVYVADSGNYRIRKIDSNHIIDTYFGTGSSTLSGDYGAATSAGGLANGVCGDTNGNIYIMGYQTFDSIRRVDSSGIVITYAGGGSDTSDGIPATAASLAYQGFCAVDSNGNLYVGLVNDNLIKMVDSSTQLISTIAGNGASVDAGDGGQATAAAISSPYGLYIDSGDNMYVMEQNGYGIRLIFLSTGVVTLFAGSQAAGNTGNTGSALSATLSPNSRVAGDALGNVYVGSHDYYNVRYVQSGTIDLLAGTSSNGYSGDGGLSVSATMSSPGGMSVYGSTLYVADITNQVIRAITFFTCTAAPSVAPVTAPTTAPSIAPSLAPIAPTEAPTTLTPTVAPFFAPTVVPGTPTVLPSTVAPTVRPSQFPTRSPTRLPTRTPTLAPSSVKPTAVPVAAPFGVSNSPTYAPVTISMDVYFSLVNVSSSVLASGDQRSVVAAVAITLHIDSSQVSFVSQTFLSPQGHLRSLAGTNKIGANVNIIASSNDFSDTVGQSADYLYNRISTTLSNAVSSGSFSNTLRLSANSYGGTNLLTAGSNDVSYSGYSTVNAATDDNGSSGGGGGASLSQGAIIGIALGGFFGLVCIFLCAYCSGAGGWFDISYDTESVKRKNTRADGTTDSSEADAEETNGRRMRFNGSPSSWISGGNKKKKSNKHTHEGAPAPPPKEPELPMGKVIKYQKAPISRSNSTQLDQIKEEEEQV